MIAAALAAGKLADLVVLDGDPTADIANTKKDSRGLAPRQEGGGAGRDVHALSYFLLHHSCNLARDPVSFLLRCIDLQELARGGRLRHLTNSVSSRRVLQTRSAGAGDAKR